MDTAELIGYLLKDQPRNIAKSVMMIAKSAANLLLEILLVFCIILLLFIPARLRSRFLNRVDHKLI